MFKKTTQSSPEIDKLPLWIRPQQIKNVEAVFSRWPRKCYKDGPRWEGDKVQLYVLFQPGRPVGTKGRPPGPLLLILTKFGNSVASFFALEKQKRKRTHSGKRSEKPNARATNDNFFHNKGSRHTHTHTHTRTHTCANTTIIQARWRGLAKPSGYKLEPSG